jgi:hypothetical protein
MTSNHLNRRVVILIAEFLELFWKNTVWAGYICKPGVDSIYKSYYDALQTDFGYNDCT